jgi:RNA polymerase sigma factor (sigma-70 family)
MNKNEQLTTYFKSHYKHLVNIARRRVGNYSLPSAEDAVQEAFWRACRYYNSYNHKEEFDKWFKRVLHNCINQIKRDERDQGVSYTDVEEVSIEPKLVVFPKEVESLFKGLSNRDKDIINMYFFLDFKSREISEMTKVSHDVVRDVIRRFRMRVKI